ncbi:hypothetical protein V6L77_16495 [Pannonibacter sp. Pt2-lr]
MPLKGYTIATQALGRDDSFNPATDPIVRVEAARLRKRLEDYYEGTGHNDPVRIIIPKGSYQPGFHPLTQEARSGNAWRQGTCPCHSGGPASRRGSTCAPSRRTALPHRNAAIQHRQAGLPGVFAASAVFFPLMALAFAAGFAAARL